MKIGPFLTILCPIQYLTIEKKQENNRKTLNFNFFRGPTSLIDKTHKNTTSVQFA